MEKQFNDMNEIEEVIHSLAVIKKGISKSKLTNRCKDITKAVLMLRELMFIKNDMNEGNLVPPNVAIEMETTVGKDRANLTKFKENVIKCFELLDEYQKTGLTPDDLIKRNSSTVVKDLSIAINSCDRVINDGGIGISEESTREILKFAKSQIIILESENEKLKKIIDNQ